jgi:maltodextrin utilization protein YvdJ
MLGNMAQYQELKHCRACFLAEVFSNIVTFQAIVLILSIAYLLYVTKSDNRLFQ